MAEKLKDKFFTEKSIDEFANTIKKFYTKFNKKKFVELIYDDEWAQKELMERMRHTTRCLRETLPDDYSKALDVLLEAAPLVKGCEAITLPDYVEQYGMQNWEESLPALGFFTKYSSSEFAIRPYLDQQPERVMEVMSGWAEDEDDKVRRFASEGCRPRLPWATALPKFKGDPSPILPVLEKLKNDESEFVRRSVANNLNDISKDHPDTALEICERWYGDSKETDWIVKHACRTLLKGGNKRALKLFGYHDPSTMQVVDLTLDEQTVAIGSDLHFAFSLLVEGDEARKIRLEYGIDFVKSSGKRSRKVFKITENDYEPGTHAFKRKQTFMDMSTRKHFAGTHSVAIIVNGEEKASASFEVQ